MALKAVKRFLKPRWQKIAITPIITILGAFIVVDHYDNRPFCEQVEDCPPIPPFQPILENIEAVAMLPLFIAMSLWYIAWYPSPMIKNITAIGFIALGIFYHYLFACLIYYLYNKLSKKQNHLQKAS